MYHSYKNRRDFSELKGKTIISVDGLIPDSEEVTIVCTDGSRYGLSHEQDCCESVYLADVVGDPGDLIGTVLDAREESNSENFPQDFPEPPYLESFTWTFYVVQTDKGCVTLRWLGQSNGFYSEAVNLHIYDEPSP